MLTDIEIARQAQLRPMEDIARMCGLDESEWEPYGRDKAKVNLRPGRPAKAKLVLVTATSGMPAGSGKTTTTIALAQALCRLGKLAVPALREPSLGPVFGMKGGAAGGGYSQVLPMESINLHFTGDFHAITSANNLISALLDNARHQGQVQLKTITWKRVMDMNERQLRNIVSGLGGPASGIPTETGFDITAASELMAILCLADSMQDLRARIDRIVLGLRADGTPFTCRDLGATGAVMALLLEAVRPNLVQTLEGTPAFIHGGPFANIAHGCSSVAATRAAMAVGDYAITEAGFGSELGAEKFFDIKCRAAGLSPDAVVLVTSCPALRWHGGAPLPEIKKPNAEALEKGLCNLEAHIANLRGFGLPVVVSINHFANDPKEETDRIIARCAELGVEAALCDGFVKGGDGALDVARAVMKACEGEKKPLRFAYDLEDDVVTKVEKVAKNVYGAGSVTWSAASRKEIAQIEELGYGKLPVCIAKTPLSLSADAKKLGAPKGFVIPVQHCILNAGAGFIVVTTGTILRMPGLPKVPAALGIDVVDGRITGLS